MIEINRISGWQLNTVDKVVNNIMRATERNNGNCPCSSNTSRDKHCPCSNYREGKGCCCNLYIKIPESNSLYYDSSISNNDSD